jgi:hypothetical protein
MVRAAAIAAAGALAGCTLITDSFLTNDFSGDPFPTQVDATSGALLVGMQPLDGSAPRTAVLDLLSPFTLRDQDAMADPKADPTLSTVDVMLLGKDASGRLNLPRARFPQAELITLHPCPSVNGDDTSQPPACTVADPSRRLPACAVGTPADLRPFDGVVGADVLAGDAIRLRLADQEIFVLADIGGSDRSRTLACEAVFTSPYRGGGTLLISGTELPFGNRRITLSACLGQGKDPDAMSSDPALLKQHGADALFVVSTSIGISILGEAAYGRYRALPDVNAPELAQLPVDTVCLPSGSITGRRATLDQIALVGPSISNGLSPCRQIYAHRMLADGPVARNPDPSASCGTVAAAFGGCPCKDGSSFCAVPAVVELTPAARIDVLVVPDTEPTLQALRTELRPDQPEVDGILGTNVLRGAEIDVDYPHDRLIARCTQQDPTGCRIRPQLTEAGDRCQINRCIYGQADTVGCPMPAP